MNPAMLKLMRAKKKRPVDPDAPPRPNLLSHEKVLKDTKMTLAQLQHQNHLLSARVEALESSLRRQTQYLTQLHQYVMQRDN